MWSFINNNSAAIALVIIVGVILYYAWKNRRNLKVAIALTLIALVLGAGYLSARHGPSDVATLAEVDSLVGSGQGVVVELYSDNCTICLMSKGSVDGLEARLEGDAEVVRLNLAEDVGRAAAWRYRVSSTPTFIVFAGDGSERYRQSGFPDIDRIEAEALNPS